MKKYYQIYSDIKDGILTGRFKTNTKLPSKRDLSKSLGVSIITVERAYGMLFEEGYILPIEKRGYFVNGIDDAFINPTKPSTKEIELLPDDTENETQDFEYSVWFKTLRKIISEKGDKLFIKSPAGGCSALKNAIAEYLLRYRKMVVNPKNVIIGSGAESLYESVVKILGRDLTYAIENPSYSQIRWVYEGMGVNVCPLNMGVDGIQSSELKNKTFDVLHVTPFNSFPSNITASIHKRYEYLSTVKQGGKYIIEDDFAGEFFIPGSPTETLYSLDTLQKVIYINTFSKSLSPSMRMGYMILPDHLLEVWQKKLGGFSCSVPVLEQYVLAEFIDSGSFERHLNKLRRKMKN